MSAESLARLEQKLDHCLWHAPEDSKIALVLPKDEFIEALADSIVRGVTCVSELRTHHQGREVRLQCEGGGARFTVYLDGRITYG